MIPQGMRVRQSDVLLPLDFMENYERMKRTITIRGSGRLFFNDVRGKRLLADATVIVRSDSVVLEFYADPAELVIVGESYGRPASPSWLCRLWNWLTRKE